DDAICHATALPWGGGSTAGTQLARSPEGDIAFSAGVHLPATRTSSDKEWTWIDNFPSRPFYHRMYVAWMNFAGGAQLKAPYSSDRGASWTTAALALNVNQFPQPVVLPNGNLIVTFRSTAGANAFIRSTDGGVTFSSLQTIV